MDLIETARKAYSEPFYVKDFSEHGQILHIQFSQFEWSQDILLIGFKKKILLAHLDLIDTIELRIVTEFSHPARCTTLSISPDTSLSTLPNRVIFCVGGNDFKIRIITSDLSESNTCLVIGKHSSYINDTMFDPENNYLASASDDNTVKIWSTDDYKLKSTFNLTSPGMNVCWHRSDDCKLLVAEKIGIIRFYNVDSETPIISIDYSKPLSSVHWAPSDRDLIASLQLGELLIWDLTKPCLPIHNNLLFTENGGNVKFSPQGELIAAVNSLDRTLKIVHVRSQAGKLTASVTLPTNVCWHYRYPLVCIGDDYKLCFWKVSAK
ncbi:nuclear pore complex protein Nup37 [Leptinotarsa decemlineata]|uniref:nuclear pore complex protein Nup37 n=1 Tax=Leptinotarsa decemlineata TaxID=7539 RepID=UPI000C2544A6|nr:nucleoporin Nup37 [Leptinotarsa decemlineata]